MPPHARASRVCSSQNASISKPFPGRRRLRPLLRSRGRRRLQEGRQDDATTRGRYPPTRFLLSNGTMGTATRRKTSFKVDFAKVDAARDILGTTTLTDTVDVALDGVIKLEQRQRLVELLFDSDALELDDPDVMASAWRAFCPCPSSCERSSPSDTR
jgi:hypothetical protein